MLGGAMFQYTLRGDRNEQKQGLQPVAGDLQRKSLDQVRVRLKEEEMRMEGGDKIEILTQNIGRLYYFFFSVRRPSCRPVYLPLCLFLSLSSSVTLCLPASLSACLSAYLPLCLPLSLSSYVTLCLCLSLCLPLCLPACLIVCLSLSLSASLSVRLHLCLCLSLCLPLCLPVCLSACLSVSFSLSLSLSLSLYLSSSLALGA